MKGHAEDRAKYSVNRLRMMMAKSDKRLDILGVLEDLETHWLAPANGWLQPRSRPMTKA